MTVLDSPGVPDSGCDAIALANAIARVRETARRQPLFTDPYVQLLVDASRSGEPDPVPPAVADHIAARTKWFDDYFLTAGSAGVVQVVILQAGFDTRAWRLPWLSDTVIYEVDRPEVLAFKQDTLRRAGAVPSVGYVQVPAVAGDDWTRALTAAGFAHDEPTAWGIEGLMPALDPQAREELLERIDLYSARGSRIAIETEADSDPDVDCWLCARHWEMGSVASADLLERYHRDRAHATSGIFVGGRKH